MLTPCARSRLVSGRTGSVSARTLNGARNLEMCRAVLRRRGARNTMHATLRRHSATLPREASGSGGATLDGARPCVPSPS